MEVKEVIALAAQSLGREDLALAVNRADAQDITELNTLLRCYNAVENELALDYYPLKKIDRLTISDGKIYYHQFAHTPVSVYEVRTSAGQLLPFETLSDCVETQKRGDEVSVTYSYAPAAKALTETCEVAPKISARLLALGVAYEYCLVTGRFREAELWESRYREALRSTYSVHESLRVRARRWE